MVQRAYSVEDIDRINFKSIVVDDEWKPHLGEPQLGNSHWLILGESAQGKTNYTLQIVKMLCKNGQKVHYNTVEEGLKKSFKLALIRNGLRGVSGFNYHQENYEQLTERLSKPRQKKIVVIDSVQYFFRGKRTEHYFKFVNQFQDTTFIWISGADGKKPIGKIASDIYFDADIVTRVENFEAIIEKNRFEANENRIIWQKGFDERKLKIIQKG